MKKAAFFLALLVAGAGIFFFQKGNPFSFGPGQSEIRELRDPQSLLDLVSQCGKEPGRVVIPPGVYRFCDIPSPGVVIRGMRRSRIVADGVTVVFKPGQSFSLEDCEEVQLSGLTVDYDPLPFTQGTIVEIDPAEKFLTVALEKGYPAVENLPKAESTLFFVFEPSTLAPRPLHTEHVREIVPNGDGTCRLSKFSNGFLFDSLGQPGGAQKGDRIALLRRNGTAVNIMRCKKVALEKVTVFTSPGYAFWEVDGEGGNHYSGCRIVRKPGTTRLVTSVADGFHSYHVRKGPLIEGCEFSDTVDDTIAIHGFFSFILETPSPRTVCLVSPFGQDFSAGAELSFHEMPHGRLLTDAVVQSVEKVPASSLKVPVGEVRQGFLRQHLNMRDLPVTQALKVELDRDIELPQGKLILVSSSEQCGSGAIVRNNTLRRGHVRGVIVKANDVLVEGNRFEGIGANAVLVFPELFFLEGPMAKGVTIRGNTITHCGWKVLSPRFANPGIGGAIQTSVGMARRQFPPQFDPYPVIRDVTISGNVIKDSGSYGIVLGNASSVRVADNKIEFPFNKPGARESKGLDRAFDSKEHDLEIPSVLRAGPSGILIYGSKEVALSGNTVTPSMENGGVEALLIGPWCDNIDIRDARGGLK